jgi:lysophospholipase L1-like esterase
MPDVTKRRPLLYALVALALLLSAGPGASAQEQWRYTALGDSLATGILSFRGYVPRYRDYVGADAGASVSLSNLGQNGWTSADLLNALQNDPNFQYNVATSEVVTWDIGGNDLRAARSSYKAKTCGGFDNQDCLRGAVAQFKSNWDLIAYAITYYRWTGDTVIRTMDIYNPYVAADKKANTIKDRIDGGNDFVVFKRYLDEVNAHIASTETRLGRAVPYAQVYRAFNGPSGADDPKAKGYIAFDGLHPSDTGHRVIADLLRQLGYAPLR